LKQSKLLHDIWLASLGKVGHNYELQVHSYGGHVSKSKKGNPASKKRNDEDPQQRRASINASRARPSLVTHRQKSSRQDAFNAPVVGLETSGSVNPRINATKSNLRRIEFEYAKNFSKFREVV